MSLDLSNGVLPKERYDVNEDDFLEVICSVSIIKRIRKAFSSRQETGNTLNTTKHEKLSSLTAREYEAFLILIEGYTLKFCAEKMGVKYSTANTYQNAIYKKLGVKNRAKLIINYKDLVRSDTHDM